MSEFKPGKYTVTIVSPPEIRVGTKKEVDPETKQPVNYHYMYVEFRPTLYHPADGGEPEPVSTNYTRSFRRSLSGGNLEGKGKEITEEKALAAVGDVFAQVGWDAFYAPHNQTVVGREFAAICSKQEDDKYDNWEPLTSSGSQSRRPADPTADKSFAKRLNILFGRDSKPAATSTVPAAEKKTFNKPKFD